MIQAEYDLFSFDRRFRDLPVDVQVSRDLKEYEPYLECVGRIAFSPDAPGAGCVLADLLDQPFHAVIELFTARPLTWAALFMGERTHIIVPSVVRLCRGKK